MHVKYQVEREDYIAFNLHHIKSVKMARPQKVLGWIIVPALLLFFGLITADASNAWWILIPYGLLGLVYAAIYPWLYRRTVARRVKKYVDEHSMVGIEGLCELILDEETINVINECWRFEIKWRYVHKIVETDTHAFIYTTAVGAAIVPKRFFLSDNEYRKVVDYAKERLAACQAMV